MKSFAYDQTGFTSRQAALAFAAFGLTAALVAPTLMDRDGANSIRTLAGLADPGIDMTTTGSIENGSGVVTDNKYIIRRSVLQQKGSAPCILFSSGRRQGDC